MAGRPTVSNPPQIASATRPWWNTPQYICFVLFMAALPLLWPAIPPFIDLPSHMGAYHIALQQGDSTSLDRYYDFHWQIIGNLGVELAVVPLSKIFGLELATKLLVMAMPVMSVAGMLWVAKEIHGELPPTVGIALPLAYCYPLHFGFVNYCLGMAFMLLAFGLWLQLGRLQRFRARALAFALIAVIVWLTHAVSWALLVIACGSAELWRRKAAGETWGATIARTVLSCLPLCTPLLIMVALPHHKGVTAQGWLQLSELAKWLATLFRDRWITLDLLTVACFLGVLTLAILRCFGMRLRGSLAFPATALFATFILAPQSINDSGFVNGRIAPYALALAALAITAGAASAARQRMLAIAATLFFAVRIAATTTSLALYSASYSSNLEALDHIDRGSAVAAFAQIPCGHGFGNWWSPRVFHLASMAIVRKDAFVNTEWQIDGLQLLRSKYAAAKPFDRDPSQDVTLDCDMPGYLPFGTALARFPRQAFDYLWLLEIPRSRWPNDPDLKLVWSNDGSALYRVVH